MVHSVGVGGKNVFNGMFVSVWLREYVDFCLVME